MIQILIPLYWLSVAALSVYGLLGLYTLWQYWRHRHDTFTCPPLPPDPPPVTIQLPIYNEPFVVERLIVAAVNLHYPSDRLQIQVIDDSTDNTTKKAARLVNTYRRLGLNITLIRRPHRQGYKAGALAQALTTTTGEFIAIFDADFHPPPEFLRQTIPHFLPAPRLGMIQTRWGHLNPSESSLTAAQAIALDKHFALEQTVRHRANLFPKFNGTAGIWRRSCLEDAGGWQDDTVCEDLCLSTRALLKNWQFRFLNEVVAPAEIPASMTAYKNQQARWAKGSAQCFLKFLRPILTASRHSLTARTYALLTMSAYATHLFLILILLLQVPLILMNYRPSSWMLLLSCLGLGQPILFVLGQQVLYPDWWRRLRHFPTLLLIAVGLAPTICRALLQALISRHHPFIRTPKRGNHTSPVLLHLPFDWIFLVEIGLAIYAFLGMGLAIHYHHFSSLLFLAACVCGFSYVAALSLQDYFLTPFPASFSNPQQTN